MGPSDWIALAAFGVAVASFVYAWRERQAARAESYRAALYERQLAETDELAKIVREVHLGLVAASDDSQGPWRSGQDASSRFIRHQCSFLPRSLELP